MYVDQSLQLWGFFDVYGSTQSIRVLSRSQDSPIYQVPINPPMIAPSNNCSAGAQTAVIRNGGIPSSATHLEVNLPADRTQQINPNVNCRVNLPPRLNMVNFKNIQQYDKGHVPGVDCTICYENPIDSVRIN